MNTAMMNVDEHRIRETAYHLWEKDGRPIGQDHRHWEMAERIAAQSSFSDATLAAVAAPRKKRAAPKKTAKIQ